MCYNKNMHKKKGDTLIEVALAIGIFSMVAIVIVSVVTASTSGAQSSLELTLAREEMDVQAEAIRFIHEGYTSGSQSAAAEEGNENPYAALWHALLKGTDTNYSKTNTIVSSKPTTCAELYNNSRGLLNNNFGSNVFVINTRRLNNPSDIDNIVVKNSGNGSLFGYDSSGGARGPFYAPSTFPRIVYGSRNSSSVANDDLLDQTTDTLNAIKRVEGLFIVPVRGTSKMPIYDSTALEEVPYYDFYISACWMAPGSDQASTLASIVRLYDYLGGGSVRVNYNYGSHAYSSEWPSSDPNSPADFATQTGKRVILRKINAPKGWTVQWRDQDGRYYSADGKAAVINTDPNKPLMEYTMYPVWSHIKYYINYKPNHPFTSYSTYTQMCYLDETCTLSSNSYTATNYRNLRRWCPGTTDNLNGGCSVTSYGFGQVFSPSGTPLTESMFNSVSHTMTLSGMWEMAYIIRHDINSPYGGNTSTVPDQYCYKDDACYVTSTEPTASGYKFIGWCVNGTVDNIRGTCSGTLLNSGDRIPAYLFDNNKYTHIITINGVWKENNETFKIILHWDQGNPYKDLDAEIIGQRSNGTPFHSYYGNKTYSESGRSIAELDRDCTDDCAKETFILNTLGGRTYYYYVNNFSSSTSINNSNTYVKIYRMDESGRYKLQKTIYSNNATGRGRVWNVFTYKDGSIVIRNTRTAAADTNY